LKKILKKLPPEIFCPISKNILLIPVTTKCGHVYEKKEIEQWVKINPICPICEKSIYISDLKDVPKEYKDKIFQIVKNSELISENLKNISLKKLKK